MATHASIPVWEIHGQRSLVGYRPRGDEQDRARLLNSTTTNPNEATRNSFQGTSPETLVKRKLDKNSEVSLRLYLNENKMS